MSVLANPTFMAQPDQPDRRRWIGLAVIVTAQFMVVLDVAIVNVALPTIKTDLHFSQESLQWVVTAYSILFGGMLLLGGRMADLLGRRRLFMAGLALFTVSSLLDGLAWSEGSLIAFRSLQGLGAALVSPAALSILTTTFEEGKERNLALGIWGAVSGSGAAAGVLLGGALTSAFGWSWIFFINVPVGAAVLAVTPRLVRESHANVAHRHFDLPGSGDDHRRADAARLRDDPRRPARLGNDRDGRPARRIGRADRRIRRRSSSGRARRCCRCGSSGCGRSRARTSPVCCSGLRSSRSSSCSPSTCSRSSTTRRCRRVSPTSRSRWP